MKTMGILVNIFVPGLGSCFVGKVGVGIVQGIIWGMGLLLMLSTIGVGGIIGLPMMLGAWVWAIVTAATDPAPVAVKVVNSDET